MPMELVTQGLEPEMTACVEQRVEGRLLLVTPGPGGTGTVQRLISTDPFDYLDPRWQPGTVLPLQ
jgi:hypothetical protein